MKLYQRHIDRYFKEYKDTIISDPDVARQNSNIWKSVEDTIRTMKLEEQAEYCDYITRKICTTSVRNDTIVRSYSRDMIEKLEWFVSVKLRPNTCIIGNMARIVVSLQEGKLRTRAEKVLKDYCSLPL